jgi:imidazoleglycerol-phosphate dehydratase
VSDIPARVGEAHRVTGETDVRVRVDLDGEGRSQVSTGVGFLDHMLDLFARHGLIDLEVAARGDLETGSHHTIEDVGITIGQALDAALGERGGIERYGSALVPMDEVLAQVAVDLSGRPLLVLDAPMPEVVIGGFESDGLREMLRGMANHAGLTLHVRVLAGGSPHHVIEACVKAVARALRMAVAHNPRVMGVPSTKGSL